MRAAIPLALLLAGCSSAPMGRGGGIVSTNPCADALLVALVPPSRIAAISHYSTDPGASSIPLSVARQFRTTAGTAEEVIALRPSLVVTSSFTPATTRAAYARAGLKTLVLDSPTTVAESKAQVMRVANAVGAIGQGRALVSGIEQAMHAATPPDGRMPAALLFIGGDVANGPGTLLDALMRQAGFRNAATDYGLAYSATISTERLVVDPPALMLSPDTAARQAVRRARVIGTRTRQAVFPRRLINCGGPAIIPALARLSALRRERGS